MYKVHFGKHTRKSVYATADGRTFELFEDARRHIRKLANAEIKFIEIHRSGKILSEKVVA